MSGTTPDIESLLVHRDFVRALARSLLGDEQLAEDVVQETWLAAFRRGPADPARARSWLAAVVSNLARRTIRSEVRRRRREQTAAQTRPEPTCGTEEIRRREQVRREVVEAVLDLPEPFRSAIVFRYFDERPPREIAKILRVPVNTVRSRLRLARERLRDLLDERHGHDRAAWALPLTMWLARSPARISAAGFAGGVAGGVLVSAKLKLLAAVFVVLLLGGGVLWWSGTRENRGTPAPPAETGSLPPSAPLSGSVAGSTGAVAETRGPGKARNATASVQGRLSFANGSRPAAGVLVTLTGEKGEVVRAKTDSEGRFVLPADPENGPFVLRAVAAGFAPVVFPGLRARAGETVRLDPPRFDVRCPLTVVVLTPEGHSVAGAKIGASPSAAALWWGSRGGDEPTPPPAFIEETGPDGRAAFDDLSAGGWVLVVGKAGLATVLQAVTLPRTGAHTRVEVRLPPAAGIAGRVLDDSGSPVSDVLVGAAPAPKGSFVMTAGALLHMVGTRRVRTGADGRFAFVDLASGRTSLAGRARTGDVTRTELVRLPGPASLDLVLERQPRGTIEGTVTAKMTGDPIPDIEISGGEARATTKEDGRYHLSGVEAGAVMITITSPGWFAGYPPIRRVAVKAGETTTLDLALSRGARITGRVLGPSGPVSGATVTAISMTGGAGRSHSGDDGTYEITGLGAGSYQVKASAPGLYQPGSGSAVSRGSTGTAAPPVALSANGEAYQDVHLLSAGEILGRIVDRDGRPIEGAMIRSIGPVGVTLPALATSEKDGTFLLSPVLPQPGTQACVTKPGYATESLTVTLPAPGSDQPFEIEMLPLARVEGVIRTAGGGPVAGARVQILANLSTTRFPLVRPAPVVVFTGEDGRYAGTAPVVSGKFDVRVDAGPKGRAEKAGIALVSDREAYRVDLTLPGTNSVSGRVVSARTGSGIAGAIVSWTEARSSVVVARTDADGAFRIEGLPAEPVALRVEAPGFIPAPPVTVGGPDSEEVRIVLREALSISGRVNRADGTAAAGATVEAYLAVDTGKDPVAATRCHDDGTFRLERLPAGAYRLVARLEGARSAEAPGVSAGKQDVLLTLGTGGAISGRVVDEAGKGISGSMVSAWPESGRVRGMPPNARTDDEGRFSVSVPGGGFWRIQVSMPQVLGAARQYRQAFLKHVSAGTTDLEIVIEKAWRISGRVRMKNGGAIPAGTIFAVPTSGNGGDSRGGGILPDGRFSIEDLRAGPHDLVFWARDAARGLLVVEGGRADAGASDVEVVLDAGAKISGVVVDGAGHPLAGARIVVGGADVAVPTSTVADAKGKFVIAGLPPGAHADLTVFVGGEGKGELRDVAAGTTDVRMVAR